MFFRVLRALRHLPYRPLSAAAVLLALAWLAGHVERLHTLESHARTAGILLAVVMLGYWVLAWLSPALSTSRWVHRRDDASRHSGGVATFTDIGELSSASRLRKRLPTLRPSCASVGFWRRRRTSLTEVGVELVRTSPVRANTVWSPCDEVTLRIGGPRSGKSGSLACHAADAPGALIVTTSRTDLLEDTHAARTAKGRIFVFNPTGLGTDPNAPDAVPGDGAMAGLAMSTVRWSPLVGCEDFGTATRRAADLIPAGSSPEGERWDEQARGLLATLLHAAARSGASMRTVLGWISPPDALARDEILDALRSSPDARAMSSQIVGLYGTNDRTLTSITATLLPRLRWVLNPSLAAAADAPLDDPGLLDVAAFVAAGRDSLYLIGRHDGAPTVIGALTAEVAHQVRMHAARQPKGRLDPPMTAVLDEIKNTCGPIPLDEWTSDMGGFNFTIHMGAQSLAQLEDLWGRARAGAILGNVGSLIVFGGIKNEDDLQHISTLTGTRLVAVDADDNRPLPVMTPAEIGALKTGEALVIRTGMRPLVGRAPWIGDRRPNRLRLVLAALAAWVKRWLDTAVQALAAIGQKPAGRPAPVQAKRAGGTGALAPVDDPAGPLAPFADLDAVARPTPDEAVAEVAQDDAGHADAAAQDGRNVGGQDADDDRRSDGMGGVA